MSEKNPFEELDELASREADREENLVQIGKSIEGSYNVSRDIFETISTISDKLFTVFTGFIAFFEGQEERFIETNNLSKNNNDSNEEEKKD